MTARAQQTAAWLYLINTVLLSVHEIDSAYWHEWELLGLPGGIQLFLVLHVPLLGLVLFGFWRVAQSGPGARAFSLLLAGVGIGAFTLHTLLLAMGHPEFRQPASLAVLAGVLLVSAVQLVAAIRSPGRGG